MPTRGRPAPQPGDRGRRRDGRTPTAWRSASAIPGPSGSAGSRSAAASATWSASTASRSTSCSRRSRHRRRRRLLADAEQAPRPVLGDPRRRRQLRRRDALPVPAARESADRRRDDHPARDAANVAGFIAAAEAAPEELTTIANVMPCPPMPFVPEEHRRAGDHGDHRWTGPAGAATPSLAPFRALGDAARRMRAADPVPGDVPARGPDYPRLPSRGTLFMDRVDRGGRQRSSTGSTAADATMRVVQLRVLGGAMARVPADATAFGHRGGRIMVNLAAFSKAPTTSRTARPGWTVRLGPRPGDGAYVNFLAKRDAERIRDAYPGSNLGPARRDQGPLRPHEPVPPATRTSLRQRQAEDRRPRRRLLTAGRRRVARQASSTPAARASSASASRASSPMAHARSRPITRFTPGSRKAASRSTRSAPGLARRLAPDVDGDRQGRRVAADLLAACPDHRQRLATSAGDMPSRFSSSANLAASRQVTFGPLPPTMIGTRGCWIGFGR